MMLITHNSAALSYIVGCYAKINEVKINEQKFYDEITNRQLEKIMPEHSFMYKVNNYYKIP